MNSSIRRAIQPLGGGWGPARGSACPILAWAVHDMEAPAARRLADRLAAAAGAPPGAVNARAVRNYRIVWALTWPNRSAWVWLRNGPPAAAPAR